MNQKKKKCSIKEMMKVRTEKGIREHLEKLKRQRIDKGSFIERKKMRAQQV